MKIWSFFVSILQFCNARQQFNDFGLKRGNISNSIPISVEFHISGVDVIVRGQSKLLERRIVSTLEECKYHCDYDSSCNSFVFSDRNTRRSQSEANRFELKPNCWIKLLHRNETNAEHNVNFQRYGNVYFYRRKINARQLPSKPREMEVSLDYTCANGNRDCINYRSQVSYYLGSKHRSASLVATC